MHPLQMLIATYKRSSRVNHKFMSVTSLGLTVFLFELLYLPSPCTKYRCVCRFISSWRSRLIFGLKNKKHKQTLSDDLYNLEQFGQSKCKQYIEPIRYCSSMQIQGKSTDTKYRKMHMSKL